MAQVVVPAARGHEVQHVVLRDELRPRAHEALRLRPERRNGGRPFQHRDGEPVLDAPEQEETQGSGPKPLDMRKEALRVHTEAERCVVTHSASLADPPSR